MNLKSVSLDEEKNIVIVVDPEMAAVIADGMSELIFQIKYLEEIDPTFKVDFEKLKKMVKETDAFVSKAFDNRPYTTDFHERLIAAVNKMKALAPDLAIQLINQLLPPKKETLN